MRLLDLFCCEGGAGTGYARAGFEVVGVDISRQPRYPFEFHQADALEYLADFAGDFDAIHASPPCQRYSAGTRALKDNDHPDLVGPTRAALNATGKPWIIENVVGAPLVNALMLCGSEFGLEARDTDGRRLRLQRHRLFESNIDLWGAGGCLHDRSVQVAGVYGAGPNTVDKAKNRHGGYVPGAKAVKADLLGCDWMTNHGLEQSVPPAYTQFLGEQLLLHLEALCPTG